MNKRQQKKAKKKEREKVARIMLFLFTNDRESLKDMTDEEIKNAYKVMCGYS